MRTYSFKNIWALALALFMASFLLLPLFRNFSLHTSFYDLGVFDNALYRIGILGKWATAFTGHVHWFALIYGIFSGFLPAEAISYFLIGTQVIILIIPVFVFYRRFGKFFALVYLIYFPLWSNGFFDFHFDHLAVLFLLGFYCNLIDQKLGRAVLCATLLMLVKEPFALQTAACGVMLLWVGAQSRSIWSVSLHPNARRKFLLSGLFLLFTGAGYFYICIHYMLPFFQPDGWLGPLQGKAFGWIGGITEGGLPTLLMSPYVVAVDILSTPKKLIYLGIIFGALGFIPLIRPIFLVPTAPLIAIAMLSRNSNYYDYNVHYTAGLIVPVMFAFVYGLPSLQKFWDNALTVIGRITSRMKQFIFPGHYSHHIDKDLIIENPWANIKFYNFFYVAVLLWILIAHILFSPSPVSRLFWSEKVPAYNWRAYIPTERDEILKAAILRIIPANPDITVATQNSVNWSYLAQRDIYLSFPLGIKTAHNEIDLSGRNIYEFWSFIKYGHLSSGNIRKVYADYVVIDLKRPYFVVDQGCEWLYGECRNKEIEKSFFNWIAYTRKEYDVVYEQDSFMIFKRRSEIRK